MVAAGTVGTAGALALFGLARGPAVALIASAMAGASWIAVLANLNVSAQVALPNWVRGRGLALFVTVTGEIDSDRGPVLVTVEYQLATENEREALLSALERLSHERRRDGAYDWGVFEDSAEKLRFLEIFLVESWLEHLRQHERVTNADRVLQERIHHLLVRMPEVRHFIAPLPEAPQGGPSPD